MQLDCFSVVQRMKERSNPLLLGVKRNQPCNQANPRYVHSYMYIHTCVRVYVCMYAYGLCMYIHMLTCLGLRVQYQQSNCICVLVQINTFPDAISLAHHVRASTDQLPAWLENTAQCRRLSLTGAKVLIFTTSQTILLLAHFYYC